MGTDRHANTVLGIEVGREELYTCSYDFVNRCKCPLKRDPQRHITDIFCPKCGEQLRKSVRSMKLMPKMGDVVDTEFSNETTIRGWKVINQDDKYYIGMYIESRYEHCGKLSAGISLVEFSELLTSDKARKFKNDMIELGLAKENGYDEKLKVWTVFSMS